MLYSPKLKKEKKLKLANKLDIDKKTPEGRLRHILIQQDEQYQQYLIDPAPDAKPPSDHRILQNFKKKYGSARGSTIKNILDSKEVKSSSIYEVSKIAGISELDVCKSIFMQDDNYNKLSEPDLLNLNFHNKLPDYLRRHLKHKVYNPNADFKLMKRAYSSIIKLIQLPPIDRELVFNFIVFAITDFDPPIRKILTHLLSPGLTHALS